MKDELVGFFRSKTVFNLSHKIFAEIKRTLKEPELCKDFEELFCRMRCM